MRIVAIALLLVAACSNTEAVNFVDETANKMCACKDLKCAEEVQADYRIKAEKFKDAKGTPSDAKAIEEDIARYKGCFSKHAAAGK